MAVSASGELCASDLTTAPSFAALILPSRSCIACREFHTLEMKTLATAQTLEGSSQSACATDNDFMRFNLRQSLILL